MPCPGDDTGTAVATSYECSNLDQRATWFPTAQGNSEVVSGHLFQFSGRVRPLVPHPQEMGPEEVKEGNERDLLRELDHPVLDQLTQSGVQASPCPCPCPLSVLSTSSTCSL